MEKWGEVGVINGRGWVMDLREGGSGTDRCVGDQRKEQKVPLPEKRGALKSRRGAQTGVWVEYSYMFQLCVMVGSYIGYFIRLL